MRALDVSEARDLEQEFADALAVMERIERALEEKSHGRTPKWRTPAWSELGVPVIERGRFAIVPIAVALATGTAGSQAGDALGELDHRLWERWGYLHGGHDYRVGRTDPDEGYGRKLAEAGAFGRGPYWWTVKDVAVVVVRSVDPGRTLESLAIHLVPQDWVRTLMSAATDREGSRRRRLLRQRDAADVAWSWPLAEG
jgi:hypothetical protein